MRVDAGQRVTAEDDALTGETEAGQEPEAPSGGYLVRRERLTLMLALPFAGVTVSFLASWPWRALDLPGTAGSLTPVGMLLLLAVAGGGVFAIGRRLPLGLITWPPAALSAVVLLATGFVSGEFEPFAGAAALIVYALAYLLVVLVSIRLIDHGAHLAMGYAALFVLGHALRFPVFETADGISGASALTAAAAVRSLGEAAIAVWLARRLVTAPEGGGAKVVWALVALAASHGFTASWEGPALAGTLSVSNAGAQVIRWLGLLLIQLGFIFAITRLRHAFSHFAVVEYVRQEEAPPAAAAQPDRRRRPTPRARRRR